MICPQMFFWIHFKGNALVEFSLFHMKQCETFVKQRAKMVRCGDKIGVCET